jgi:hypothetical protein
MKPQIRKNKKVYRIALYGASGSGKTCILAALAIDRLPHPEGLSCTWLPSGQEAGRKWLKEAVSSFEENRLPKPSEVTTQPPTFDFNFSADGRTYAVEMIDYAGELVNPVLSDNENAKLLFNHLKNMDALLVLAPVPKTDGHHSILSRELLAVRRTFEKLREQMSEKKAHLDTPVALIVNAWDRVMDHSLAVSENQTYVSEQQKLNELLFKSNTLLPHRGLYDALKNSVPENDFTVFPVSAIGLCEKVLVDGHEFERPKNISPLHSFGLENPFVWALRRRDEIDVVNLEQAVSQLTVGKGTRFIPWPPLELLRQGKAILKRFPRGSDLQKKTHVVVHQLREVFWSRAGMTAVYFLSAVLITEATIDGMRYRSVNAVLHDPKASVEQLQKAEDWLDQYQSSSFGRHLLYTLSAKTAGIELEKFRSGREDLFAEPLKSGTSSEQKAKAAEDYLKAFPNGKYRAEAVKAIQGFETLQSEITWREVQSSSSLADKAKRANDYLKKFPYSDHAADARQILSEAANAKSWDDFVKQYNGMISDGRLSDAAELLVGRRPETPDLKALKAGFPSQALEKLSRRIQETITNSQWEQGIEELDNASRWSPDVVNDQVQSKIRELREQLDKTWDLSLYQTVLSSRTTDNLQTYLAQAPIKSMKTPVQDYLDYLAKQQGQLDLKLTLVKVRWNPDITAKSEVRYEVAINGNNIIYATGQEGTRGHSGDFVSVNQIGSFKGRLSEEVTLNFAAVGDGMFGKADLGRGNRKLAVSSLNGYSLDIRDDDGNVSTVQFSLQGMPKAPEMPAWRK